MANLGNLLKNEIVRLAQKTLRQQLAPLQSASSSHRRQLSALKKQLTALEREVARLQKAAAGAPATRPAERSARPRFVAKGLVSQRARLGLGAREFGLLLGVSAQTVYNWEAKKATPRAAQLEAIAALRGIGKREAQSRLAALEPSAG